MLAVSTVALGLTPVGSQQAHAQSRRSALRAERQQLIRQELRRLRRHELLRRDSDYCCNEHLLEAREERIRREERLLAARLREERIRREMRREERRREYRRLLRRQIEREALGFRWLRGRERSGRERPSFDRPWRRGYDETMRPLPRLPEYSEEVTYSRGGRGYRYRTRS
jgi:hypothetical protein